MNREATILEPLDTPVPAEFPHDETVPEGCRTVDGWQDEYGYFVELHDVVYAVRQHGDQNIELHLHVYQPQLPEFETTPEEQAAKRWPTIVFVQGSAFHKQKLTMHSNMLIRMASRGYVVAAMEYRPSEIAPIPAQMQDCKTAIRFVKKNAAEFHCDPEHIAIWGESSGGHTVLMAGFTGDEGPDTDLYGEYSASVNCIVDWYGPTDFAKMNCVPSSQNHYDPDSPEGFAIGYRNVLENPELNAAASPMTYLRADKEIPPVLIMHGSRDMLVPFNQSCLLYERLKELDKDVTFVKLNNANHGIYGFMSDNALDMVDEFIRKHI